MPQFNPLAEHADSTPEDVALVTRVQAGDRDALATLLTRHQPWVYSILVRMLLFAHARVTRVRDVAPDGVAGLEALDAAYGQIHRDHPFHAAPDIVAALRRLPDSPACRSLLAG
jgi:hypothetical protein